MCLAHVHATMLVASSQRVQHELIGGLLLLLLPLVSVAWSRRLVSAEDCHAQKAVR